MSDTDTQSKKWVTSETPGGSFKTSLVMGEHKALADEPTSVGGSGLGPTPYDYLLAALGACTTMTVQMYAQRKGWKLDNVKVSLAHRKEHKTDCETCDEKPVKVDVIEKQIEFIGDLDAEQIERLKEISSRCPVHRTLLNEIQIETTLV